MSQCASDIKRETKYRYIYKMSFTAFPLIVKVTALDLSGETGEVKYFYEIGNIVVRRKMFLLSLDILDKCVIC